MAFSSIKVDDAAKLAKAGNVINWDNRIVLYVVFFQEESTPLGVSRIKFGADAGTDVQAFANLGIGVSVENAALKGIVHDGSAGTTIDLGTTMVEDQTYGVKVDSDGAGNVRWSVNGISKGASSLGPTGDGAASDAQIKIETENNSAFEQEITVTSIKNYVEQ